MKYYIKSTNNKFFLDLCGHYTITSDIKDASHWDDQCHKAMWFYVHELRATTNNRWFVVDEYQNEVPELEEARTFAVIKANTIENVELDAIVEPETFNEAFNGDKPEVHDVYYAILSINGKTRYIPIARVDNKFYRYKHSLREVDNSGRFWRW